MFGAAILRRHALTRARSALAQRSALQARPLHVTAPVFKKKHAVDNFDDNFDEFEIVDESLKAAPTKEAAPTASTSALPQTDGKRKLTQEERHEAFTQKVAFMKPRLGRRPTVTGDYIRNSAWIQLLQMATTKEELKELVDIMPLWKDSLPVYGGNGRVFTAAFAQIFVQRCQQYECPQLALDVFGNYAKYHLPLDIVSGRQLMHAVIDSPIENVMTTSALYGLYGLPPVSQDFVSCSLMVQACLKKNDEYSNTIAEALLPHLRELTKTPKTVDVKDTFNQNGWVKQSVEAINSMLEERKQPGVGELVFA